MTELLNLIIYIFRRYPNIDELSKPRLVKLIYLIDWKHSIDYGKQASPINWYFNHYGPYVDTVIELIKSNTDIFEVTSYQNIYGGGTSDKIKLIKQDEIDLEDSIKQAADFIITNTAHKNWSDFINLVYSTYPVKNNSKYSFLNLVEDAEKFKQEKLQRI